MSSTPCISNKDAAQPCDSAEWESRQFMVCVGREIKATWRAEPLFCAACCNESTVGQRGCSILEHPAHDASLVLLQAEFLDRRLDLGACLVDDRAQLVRGR